MFSSEQERDAFGNWLSGFTDGEGCFYLGFNTPRKNRPGLPDVQFTIALRDDDKDILDQVHSYFECGRVEVRRIRIGRPMCRYISDKPSDIVQTIIPHFEKYPLRAKKSRDFEVWKIAASFVYSVIRRPIISRRNGYGVHPRWTPEDLLNFSSLVSAIKSVREYRMSDDEGTFASTLAKIAHLTTSRVSQVMQDDDDYYPKQVL